VRRRSLGHMGRLDLRSDAWIPGVRVADAKASPLAEALRLKVQRPCSTCGEPTRLHRSDLAAYDKGVPLLCAPCVGEAFVDMRPRE